MDAYDSSTIRAKAQEHKNNILGQIKHEMLVIYFKNLI
jgi:hypothetical protein